MTGLRPYQTKGAEFLLKHRRALLADSPGLGKTLQTITALDTIYLLSESFSALIVCPAIAVLNWEAELDKFAPHLPKAVLSKLEKYQPERINICSYEHAIKHRPGGTFTVLVGDEAHYLRNRRSKRTRYFFHKPGGRALQSEYVWLLTGTPVVNYPDDLYPTLKGFGIITAKFEHFQERYCSGYWDKWGFKVTGANEDNAAELRGLLNKVMLRRKKEDVLPELPPLTVQDWLTPAAPVDVAALMPAAFEKYKTITAFRAEIARQEAQIAEALDYGDLEEIQAHVAEFRQFSALSKVPAVVESLTEELDADAGLQILIFAHHNAGINALKDGLARHGPEVINGQTPNNRRADIVREFQAGSLRLIIANIQAAGTAITLTAATEVIFLEQSWSPSDNAQAMQRAHRIGQTKPVRVRVAQLNNKIDRRVSELLLAKTEATDLIL